MLPRVVGEVKKRTSRETSALFVATVFILFFYMIVLIHLICFYVHTKLTNKVVLGALRHYIVLTSFIKHGTGTALPDDNGRTLVTTAPH
jgi:hypothetical protein